jgi:3-oxoacyl-[acyl-carrier protein] reductase
VKAGEIAMKLTGKVAIVTGSAGVGIGYAIARSFVSAGAHVVIADAHEARSRQTATQLQQEFDCKTMGIQCDVTNRCAVEQVVSLTLERFGRIDILVNNAGTNRPTNISDMSDEAWNLVINTSLRGTFYFCRSVLPIMKNQQFGRIVNIASTAAFEGLRGGHAHYAAAKAGVMAFTRCLAMEAADRFITANTIAPSFIYNDFVPRIYPESEIARMEESIPYPRKGTPDDVAKTALFLVTDGEYITGQTICVTGGSWMH